MKIKHLKENLTPASTPSVKTIPPKFGRSDEMLESGCGGTSSGDVGSVAAPMGKMQKRGKGSMFAGIKTSEKFANSRKAGIKEGKNSELDSLYDQYDELDYDGNSESDKEKMRHIQQKIKDLKAKDKKVNESYYNHDDNRTGFSKPTRQDDERNPEFDDKMRKLTGMIFYNVNDPDLAQQLGLKQTRTGKWFLRTGNRNAQQAADRAFGQGKVWYPQNESMEEGQQWPDSSNSLAKRSAVATNLKGAPSNAGRASGMTVATRVDPSITSTKVQRKDDRPIPSFLQKEDVESSPVTDLKTWQVVIFNNYYAGKYSDYRGRYYYVLARNADEAKQVVLDNSDGILKDILSMKSHNGKRILPPSKAVPITSGRIGKIEDGTVAGRMSTAGYKKMFGPQGLVMAKLSGGAVQDIQGQEQGVAEGQVNEKSKSQAQFRTMAAVAHNPKFAKKVGISQKVGKEFHSADRKQNYKDLPKEVDEASFDYTMKDLGNDYAGFASNHSMKHKFLARIKPEKQQLYKDKMNNTHDWDSLFALFNVAKQRGDIIEQGVTEGVAETMSMDEAKKVLRHYGADNFKTTSNELYFYKNGQQFSIDLTLGADSVRSVSLSQLNQAARQLKGQGLEEGLPRDQDSRYNPDGSKKKQWHQDPHWQQFDKDYAASRGTMGTNASLEQHADDKMKELGHKFKGVAEGSDDNEPFDYEKWKASTVKSRKPRGYKEAEFIAQQQKEINRKRKEQEQGVAECDNPEYDDEAGSAESNLHTIARAAQGLIDSIGENDNLPEWCQEKIAKVEGMLVAVWDYLESQEEEGIDPQVDEDWQKTNKHDKTDGMSPKAVKAYRRENPGSKLKTAVTTKPSKLKAGSKDANRRKSFCARMSGNKGPMKDEKGRPTPKAKALSRWNCESVEQTVQMLESVQHDLAEMKQRLDPKCWKGYKKQGTKMKGGTRVNNCVPIDEAEVSEDKIANDLYKDFQIFKKGADKGIGSKAKDKEISGKAKDKEIIAKEGFGDTIKKKAKQFSRYMTEPNSPHNDQVRSRAKNIDKIRKQEEKKSVFEKDPEAMREFERSGGYEAGIDVMGWQVGWAAAKHAQGDTMKEAFQKLYYGGGASFPFSQKAFKLAWVAYNKHYGPQGNLEEMDGDGAGRDGSNRKSHSTYGSRDKHHASNGPDIHLGSDSAMTSKDIQDRALDTLTKMLSKPENMNVLKRLKNK